MQTVTLRMERQKCSLGCPILDRILNGGVPCGSVTELVGESSAGKTQLCLQLLLTVQLPIADGGLEGSALYIYTENYFASSRLRQLAGPQAIAARARHRHLFADKPANSHTSALGQSNFQRTKVDEADRPSSVRACFKQFLRGDSAADTYGVYHPAKVPAIYATAEDDVDSRDAGDPCKNVFVQGLHTAEELLRYLDHAEAIMSHPLRMPVRLLVIDSIAALFRAGFGNSMAALTERSNLFFQISSKLKKLAERHDIAVVVTNQVSDYFEPPEASRRDPAPGLTPRNVIPEILMTSGRRVVPALGISWAHCVNTRLFLSRVNYGPNTTRRSIGVVFAPHLPNGSCDFLVDADGVKGVPPQQLLKDKENHRQQFDYNHLVDGAPPGRLFKSATSAYGTGSTGQMHPV